MDAKIAWSMNLNVNFLNTLLVKNAYRKMYVQNLIVSTDRYLVFK